MLMLLLLNYSKLASELDLKVLPHSTRCIESFFFLCTTVCWIFLPMPAKEIPRSDHKAEDEGVVCSDCTSYKCSKYFMFERLYFRQKHLHHYRNLDKQDPSGVKALIKTVEAGSYLARLNASSRSCPLLITGILCKKRLNMTLEYKVWLFLFWDGAKFMWMTLKLSIRWLKILV